MEKKIVHTAQIDGGLWMRTHGVDAYQCVDECVDAGRGYSAWGVFGVPRIFELIIESSLLREIISRMGEEKVVSALDLLKRYIAKHGPIKTASLKIIPQRTGRAAFGIYHCELQEENGGVVKKYLHMVGEGFTNLREARKALRCELEGLFTAPDRLEERDAQRLLSQMGDADAQH